MTTIQADHYQRKINKIEELCNDDYPVKSITLTPENKKLIKKVFNSCKMTLIRIQLLNDKNGSLE